jgi:hypothetical protein
MTATASRGETELCRSLPSDRFDTARNVKILGRYVLIGQTQEALAALWEAGLRSDLA